MILVREEERDKAEQGKKKLLAVYITVACLFVAVALLLLFLSPDGYKPYMIGDILLTIAFGFYSVFFFSVQFDHTVKEYRLLDRVFAAHPEKEYGVFLGEKEVRTYEGVEMRTLLFRVLGSERDIRLFQGEPALKEGEKYLLMIRAGVLTEIEETDEKAIS
ncbi:MAG TPA: hypothetical protein DCG79_01520 [Clostridiales bacterium]|nr:hypothetical protein [Clostridiales bacterium]